MAPSLHQAAAGGSAPSAPPDVLGAADALDPPSSVSIFQLCESPTFLLLPLLPDTAHVPAPAPATACPSLLPLPAPPISSTDEQLPGQRMEAAAANTQGISGPRLTGGGAGGSGGGGAGGSGGGGAVARVELEARVWRDASWGALRRKVPDHAVFLSGVLCVVRPKGSWAVPAPMSTSPPSASHTAHLAAHTTNPLAAPALTSSGEAHPHPHPHSAGAEDSTFRSILGPTADETSTHLQLQRPLLNHPHTSPTQQQQHAASGVAGSAGATWTAAAAVPDNQLQAQYLVDHVWVISNDCRMFQSDSHRTSCGQVMAAEGPAWQPGECVDVVVRLVCRHTRQAHLLRATDLSLSVEVVFQPWELATSFVLLALALLLRLAVQQPCQAARGWLRHARAAWRRWGRRRRGGNGWWWARLAKVAQAQAVHARDMLQVTRLLMGDRSHALRAPAGGVLALTPVATAAAAAAAHEPTGAAGA